MRTKVFARQGNYTAVDNAVLDVLMAQLSGNQFKILMAIVRRTVGWHDEEVGISVRDFQRMTGIASFETISKALTALVEMRLITQSIDGTKTSIYALNRDFELDTVTETVTPTVTETVTHTVTETVTPTVTETVTPTVTETVTHTVTETVTPSIYKEKEKERGKNARAREGRRTWLSLGIPPPEGEGEADVVQHPAVLAWMSAGFEWPGYEIAPRLVEHLGDVPDVDLLIRAKQMWELSGNKPTNYLGIMDWYDELRVDPDWSPGPVRANGGRKRVKAQEHAPVTW